MSKPVWPSSRRAFLSTLTLRAAAFMTPALLAEELARTPRLTEGPFYPDQLPLDTDNDLLVINDSITLAIGEITHLGGKVLDATGSPIKNAVIEIWQVDNRGVYIHSADSGRRQRDANFQGFGRFTTGSTGEYYFRTIKPVPYTQIFINGHPQNNRDGVFRGIRDPSTRPGRFQAGQGFEDR